MKKLNIFMSALLGIAFTACTENYDPEVGPQTYAPESPLATSDVTMTSEASAIDIESLIEAGSPITIGTVAVREGAMPVNTVLKAEVEFSNDPDYNNSVILPGSIDEMNLVTVSASDLQDAYFNYITRNPKTTDLYMRTTLFTVTNGAAEAIIGKPGENYYAVQNVQFKPLFKVQISPAYYVIGAAGGWSPDGARTQKFEHSDADVYDDPIFSIIIDAGGDDCWFAIGDDASLDAIDAGDWTQLLGTKGESEDLTGTMDFRYNLGGDHSFHVQGAKKIRITLDMMEYSYTIEPVNIAENYYLIGGPGDWSADAAMEMQFNHSNKDVFEDPVFTYTFAGNGGDMWFAFGDKDAIDAVAAGDWSQLFGTKGESTDLSGNFDRRYNLDGDHSFCVDGKATFYRFTINLAEMTYEITPLDFAEYIYEAGVNNDWGSVEQPLYCGDGAGTYVGFFYAQDADWSDGKGAFKFQKEFNNWDVNWGFGSGDETEGTLAEGGDNIMVTPGFYRAEINLANMSYKLTQISTIGIIGPAQAGGWDTDTDMTYNAETGAWEATIDLAADEIKFRANDGWDINWGGSTDNLTQDGANLKIDEAGTYFVQFFPICETKSYCTITKK
jgi:hypothetical protein